MTNETEYPENAPTCDRLFQIARKIEGEMVQLREQLAEKDLKIEGLYNEIDEIHSQWAAELAEIQANEKMIELKHVEQLAEKDLNIKKLFGTNCLLMDELEDEKEINRKLKGKSLDDEKHISLLTITLAIVAFGFVAILFCCN